MISQWIEEILQILQKTAARIGYLVNKLQTGTITRRRQTKKKNSHGGKARTHKGHTKRHTEKA